jgi:hypothetical protein
MQGMLGSRDSADSQMQREFEELSPASRRQSALLPSIHAVSERLMILAAPKTKNPRCLFVTIPHPPTLSPAPPTHPSLLLFSTFPSVCVSHHPFLSLHPVPLCLFLYVYVSVYMRLCVSSLFICFCLFLPLSVARCRCYERQRHQIRRKKSLT